MKQKALIKNSLVDHKKSAPKALKIAAAAFGVESVSIKGDNKDQIEVIGEGMDTIELTRLLRKKIGGADLITAGPVEVKKQEKKPEVSKNVIPVVQAVWGSSPYYPPTYPVYYTNECEPTCSIM